ncbi:MAG: quinolinate synthase NadA [Elusimicrobiota bacterium]
MNPLSEKQELVKQIRALQKERHAIIIAHNYQIEEVQEIADILGDSLELARTAARTDAETIVFCGVRFMAETAAVLNPNRHVLIPDLAAGCPLAEQIDADQLRKLKSEHPDAAVVVYVNSSAEVKAEADVCCTSSNAVHVVNALKEEKVIFAPDKNLGRYVSSFTTKELILWDGFCPTHAKLTKEDVIAAQEAHPDAIFMAHPECSPEVLALADYVFSTGGMFKHVPELAVTKIIIGTEYGMLYRLQKQNPNKQFFVASPKLVCPNMKRVTLEKIKESLAENKYEVHVPEVIRLRAKQAIQRMLDIV